MKWREALKLNVKDEIFEYKDCPSCGERSLTFSKENIGENVVWTERCPCGYEKPISEEEVKSFVREKFL